jgi:serine-type D-Ala-D-Ala carboxypeptidase (penicillin-binding protein 5/6)
VKRPSLAVMLALAAFLVIAAPAAARRSPPPKAPRYPIVPPDPRQPPVLGSAAAILVDARTGQVLFEQNSHARVYPASTTKILTSILLLETANLADTVTASENASTTKFANLYLQPGERISMEDLVYAIMLRSANDGSVAAAEHVAGSVEAFAHLMNEKAAQIGCTDSHFVNPNGVHDPEHYTSAADLAKIACYAIRNPRFNEIARTEKRVIGRSVRTLDNLVRNHNKLLGRFPGADGIKTGYVRQSGRCLVASATRPEGNGWWRLISVVMKSPDTYGESKALLDWGFRNFHPVTLARKGQVVGAAPVTGGARREAPLVAREEITAVVRRGQQAAALAVTATPLTAPVAAGQPAGSAQVRVDGKVVLEQPLLTAEAVGRSFIGELARPGGGVRWSWAWVALAVLGGGWYARSAAKGARRRGRRLAARGGGVHRRRPRARQRPARGAWDEY